MNKIEAGADQVSVLKSKEQFFAFERYMYDASYNFGQVNSMYLNKLHYYDFKN